MIRRYVQIFTDSVRMDGVLLPSSGQGGALLSSLYREKVGDYPKFFKMDTLCKCGFLAAELLLEDDPQRFVFREDRAVILFSKNGPLCDDRHYKASTSPDDYFPSPSLFVYTLANIITGEIAIRNKFGGETTAFILDGFDAGAIQANVLAAFEDEMTSSAICGWVDCSEDDDFEAFVMLVDKSDEGKPFDAATIDKLKKEL